MTPLAAIANDATDECTLLHAAAMSILLIWSITFVAESEKLARSETAEGMYGLSVFHGGVYAGALSFAMSSSILERPVMPLAVTVALRPAFTSRLNCPS